MISSKRAYLIIFCIILSACARKVPCPQKFLWEACDFAREGKSDFLDRVILACKEGKPKLRKYAIETLGMVGNDTHKELLINLRDGDSDIKIRAEAKRALRRLSIRWHLKYFLLEGKKYIDEFIKLRFNQELIMLFNAIDSQNIDEHFDGLNSLLVNENPGYFMKKGG
ncbi:MAG: HEAT repeat domain-containing protein [Planctomycetota bacterium]|jgi:hypothetical protein